VKDVVLCFQILKARAKHRTTTAVRNQQSRTAYCLPVADKDTDYVYYGVNGLAYCCEKDVKMGTAK
jgi:hypothetical protein